jgi:hypothetical protein
MWRFPLREEDVDNEGATPRELIEMADEVDGAVGKPDCWPSQPAMMPAPTTAVAMRRVLRIMEPPERGWMPPRVRKR